MRERFPRIREIRFDPWQMVASAPRLKKAVLPMVELPRTVSNLTEASQNLYDFNQGWKHHHVSGSQICDWPSAAPGPRKPAAGGASGRKSRVHKGRFSSTGGIF